jgi:hypothetical protein
MKGTIHIPGLGAMLRKLKEQTGRTLDKLSVFSVNNDPYRQDTPANHRNGAWLREQIDRLLPGGAPIHLRGLHYVFVTAEAIKPNREIYRNTDHNAFWMSDTVARPARWLSYVPFDRIVDERNAPPVVRPAAQRIEPEPFMGLVKSPELSDYDLDLGVGLSELSSPQTYRLAIFGEKTSLEAVLGPLAEEYNADLYLAAGEQTITHLHKLAQDANDDGRELIVFVFADCDPAGYQMFVSIIHKLRALKDMLFPNLKFRAYAPCLTVEQVRVLGLPDTPLKESERRRDRWRERMGVEQTEIDSLATLNPAELERIAREAFNPFFDHTLAKRIKNAQRRWTTKAWRVVNAAAEHEQGYTQLREEAEDKLEEAKRTLKELEEATDLLASRVDLPEFEMPEAKPPDDGPEPLVSSDMNLLEHIDVLRARKEYAEGGE